MNEYNIDNNNQNITRYSQQRKRSKIFNNIGIKIIQNNNSQNNNYNNHHNNNQNILQNNNNFPFNHYQSNPINNNDVHQNNNKNILQNNNNISPNNNQIEIENIKLIWIDYEVNNPENTIYQNKLRNILSFKSFKLINEGMEEIKKINFKRIMIMLSKRMFEEFITLFEREKKNICCSLNILVFTNKKSEVEEICKNNRKILSGYLFNYKEYIFDDFNKVIEFIKKEKNGNGKSPI